MYYFFVLKERERLTCVRVDWVYSCDVSSIEERKKKRRIRVGNPKILLSRSSGRKKVLHRISV